MEELKELKK
jgi:hypothetical protein